MIYDDNDINDNDNDTNDMPNDIIWLVGDRMEYYL